MSEPCFAPVGTEFEDEGSFMTSLASSKSLLIASEVLQLFSVKAC